MKLNLFVKVATIAAVFSLAFARQKANAQITPIAPLIPPDARTITSDRPSSITNFPAINLEVAPSKQLLLAESNADELFDQCIKRFQSEDYKQALKSCNQAIQADKNNDEAYIVFHR